MKVRLMSLFVHSILIFWLSIYLNKSVPRVKVYPGQSEASMRLYSVSAQVSGSASARDESPY